MNKKTIYIVCICAAALIVVLLLIFKPWSKTAAAVSPSPAAASESAPAASVSPDASAAAETKAPAAGSALSADELKSFETLLNQGGNYGFLLSQYSDVRSADLTQVFYVGADITPAADAQSILDAYNAALGDAAPQTDCTVLKTSQIDAFLQEKAGCTLKQMKSQFDWEYDPEHDAYLFFHGDTNQVPIKVASGKALGNDKYQLTCTFDGNFYDPSAGAVSGCVVTFSYKNGKPVFISNTFVS